MIDTLGMGGAETWLMEVLRLWTRSGEVQLDFLLTSGNEGVFDREASRLGAKLHYLCYGRRDLATFTRGLNRILRKGCYGVIHDHQNYASGWHYLLGCPALPRTRITHVHTFGSLKHGDYFATRRIASQTARYLVSLFATLIVGTSKHILSQFGFDSRLFGRTPKAALYCGFNTNRFAGDSTPHREQLRQEFGWRQNSRILLSAGRIDRSPDCGNVRNLKNSAFAVQIAIEAAKADPRVCAIFAGKPSDASPVLERRIREAGLAERIRLMGIRRDVEHLMLGSDLLLFPSRGEGLGMVAVEAQAAGLPVLASTAVPRECVVSKDAVMFVELDEEAGCWVKQVLERLERPPLDHRALNRMVAESPFGIENSARSLRKMYESGQLPL